MDDGYQSGGTPGGKWGCGLAVLAGVPLLGLVILTNALGDRVPVAPCHHSLDWLLMVAALAKAAAVGFGSRALIDSVIRHRKTTAKADLQTFGLPVNEVCSIVSQPVSRSRTLLNLDARP